MTGRQCLTETEALESSGTLGILVLMGKTALGLFFSATHLETVNTRNKTIRHSWTDCIKSLLFLDQSNVLSTILPIQFVSITLTDTQL